MNDSIFGSIFETSLRILILLNCSDELLDIEEIQSIDFVALYAHEYGFTDTNLNGDNPFMYSEVASNRNHLKAVIRDLVLKSLVDPHATENGMRYSLSEKGQVEVRKLSSTYAHQYRTTIMEIMNSNKSIALPDFSCKNALLFNLKTKRGELND